MKVLAIVGSLRKRNTHRVVEMVEKRLKELGQVEFEYVNLKDLDLGDCRGCNACVLAGESPGLRQGCWTILRIKIIVSGKIRERYLREGAQEYLKRLRPYANVELVELQDEPVPERSSEKELEAAREVEAGRIMKACREGDYLVALDIVGKQLSSEGLSEWFKERGMAGDSSLVFVIGGTTGLAESIISRAKFRLSMGPMTFPHQFMPMLLLEQIYRAMRIGAGEPYHR